MIHVPLRRYFDLLSAYFRPQRAKVAWLVLLLLGSIALQLVQPQILRYVIDSAVGGAPPEPLAVAALLFMVAALGNQVLGGLAQYAGEDVGWTATNALRADLALHCLRLDQSFHKAHTPGELIERIDGDINGLSNFFSQFTVRVLGNVLLLVGVLALVFREDWRAGLALTIFATGGLLLLEWLRRLAVPYWRAVREVSAQLFGFLGERLSGTEDIRASGAVPYVMRRFYELLRVLLRARRRANASTAVMIGASIVIFAGGGALALAVGGTLWSAGAITLGTVYLLFHYTEMLRLPMEQIRNELQDLQRAGASIDRVEEFPRHPAVFRPLVHSGWPRCFSPPVWVRRWPSPEAWLRMWCIGSAPAPCCTATCWRGSWPDLALCRWASRPGKR